MKRIILKFNVIAIILVIASSLAFAGGNKYARHRKMVKTSEAPIEAAIIQREIVGRIPIRDVYVIHFIIDGTNSDAFNRAISEGKLPVIKENFVDNGAVFENGLSAFPSTSSTVYAAYATGLWPGHAGIPHIQRFDREERNVIDYLTVGGHNKINTDLINLRALVNPDSGEIEPPTTMFELLDGHPTAAVYSGFFKGASEVHPKTPFKALWSTFVTGNIENVDRLAFDQVMDLFEGDFERIPRYSLVGLYSADILGHEYGPQSKQVVDVLVQFDVFLKNFLGLLKTRGIADKTYIIITADHGMHDTGRRFRFKKEMEAKGVYFKPGNPRDRDYTLFSADRGVVSSHIYAKHDGGFKPIKDADILRHHPTLWGEPIDLIDAILGLDATELLIVRDGTRRARVFNHEGKAAEIACFMVDFTDYCSYNFDKLMGDPLGYSSNENLAHLLDGKPHATLEWKYATADETYPDAVINLSQIFHDGRAGDAFITARDGYGFRRVKKGNHGGLIDKDMRTPFLIAGPTVPRGKFGVVRPVDIYPLMLEWFGLGVSDRNYDGVNPFLKHEGENKDYVDLAALEQLFEKNPSIRKMIDVPRFVREEVVPLIGTEHFHRLEKLAEDEMKRRYDSLARMNSLMAALKAQKSDDEAPKVCDPDYLNDHIAIVDRTAEWLRSGYNRLDDIAKVLTNCHVPSSVECGGL